VAAAVHGARDQLLAGTRLSLYQNGRHAAGHLDDARLHGAHDGRFADQLFQYQRRVGGGRQGEQGGAMPESGRAFGLDGRRGVFGALYGRRDDVAKLFEVYRLGEVVKRTGLEGLHRIFGGTVGRDDHAALRPLLGHQVAQQFKAQAVRQTHVGNDGIEAVFAELLASLLQVAGGFHPIALPEQRQLIEGSQVRLIVNDEDAGLLGGGGLRAHG
jgi:hypothetical protein